MIIHLPNNDQFNIDLNRIKHLGRCMPEVGKNFFICYNTAFCKLVNGYCYCNGCWKCWNSIVVEKTEDNEEIWVEFINRGR